MINQIHRHAKERLNFTGESALAERVAACKAFLAEEMEVLLERHRAGESGTRIALFRATIIDALLSQLFEAALDSYRRSHGEPPAPVVMIALGGYGRAELSPLSDIDFMLLFPLKKAEAGEKVFREMLANEILYVLWDTKLKIGHSMRTIPEVFEEARKEIRTKTSLLESRRITGSEQLYTGFYQDYRKFYLKEDPKGYIAARLQDQADRRGKYGNTVFLQEPDVKNGVGGLRDFQNALWMARVKLGIDQMDELFSLRYLRGNELEEFQRGYDFLLRVRNEMHFQSRHANDKLTLDAQPEVARELGYPQADPLERVEAFMRDYYRHAQAIHRISKVIENRLSLAIGAGASTRVSFREAIRARRGQRVRRIDGFLVRGQELAAEKEDVFKEDPRRLIRVFRHGQQLHCEPDLDLASLIRASLPLIARNVIRSPEANLSFQTILEDAGQVAPTLHLMHELGVLGRFLPEFDQLTCLVQHEYYHRYTADIHTLSAIEELDRVFSGEEEITAKYREELHAVTQPTLLYLILLLHDIGKAGGIQDHSERGVLLAEPILDRLQIDPGSRELVQFVIRNHLLMARFWQKHDVEDPATASAFADLVHDPDHLRLLYVHTFCDARGTDATVWNSYKDALHTTLFRATLDRLTLGGQAVEQQHAERNEMVYKDFVSRNLPGISAEEIEAHFSLLPERYFIHTDAEEIALHIRMVNRLLKSIVQAESMSTLRPVIDWKDDLNRSLTVVNVVTWDRAGLFYKLAGAFSMAGLNILSAKVISREDHIAIDTFYVVEPGGGVVQNQQATDRFTRNIEEALIGNRDLLPDIEAQAAKVESSLFERDRNTLQKSFPPRVEIYHELSVGRTIVEIEARDRIGLLYRLAKAIFDHGFDITFARINTERGVAIDTFYIENAQLDKALDNARLEALRAELMEVVPRPVE